MNRTNASSASSKNDASVAAKSSCCAYNNINKKPVKKIRAAGGGSVNSDVYASYWNIIWCAITPVSSRRILHVKSGSSAS